MAGSGRPIPKRSSRLPDVYIREWRRERGLTQEQLAERIERSTSAVSQLESGRQGYSREMLAALAHALNCEPADLFRDPTKPDYALWRIITGMRPEAQEQAVRVLRAIAGGRS